MKATQRDFAGMAARAVSQCGIFLFCGPDEAGAAAAAEKLIAMLEKPGERIELQGADLRRDPVLLGDEARSGSLFGDSRHVFVRASGDEAHDALANYLASLDAGEPAGCPILILATSATDKSRTAGLLEGRRDSLVVMFHPPDLRAVSEDVRRMAEAAGIRLQGGLADRIARASALDVRLARSEIDKLALYLDASSQTPRTATPEALDAIGATAPEDSFLPIVNAVLSGESRKLAGELRRMRECGLNPVGLLLAVERRVAQLAALSARLGRSRDITGLIEEESRHRRVFFRDKRDLIDQLGRWRGDRLGRLAGKLVELHRRMLAHGPAGELLLAQGLAEITRFARANPHHGLP